MSLVEQAARKLEQLRKAGEQVAGDLAYPVSRDPAAPGSGKDSTIERIAKELEKRQRPSAEPATTQSAEPVMRVAPDLEVDTADANAESQRREPVLRPATSPHAPTPSLPKVSPVSAGTVRPRVADID